MRGEGLTPVYVLLEGNKGTYDFEETCLHYFGIRGVRGRIRVSHILSDLRVSN